MSTRGSQAAALVRRWRFERHQRKMQLRLVKQQRDADHLERLRAGIKDVQPPAF